MSEILKPIDINQLFKDISNIAQCIETFELSWIEKKGLVDNTPPHLNTCRLEKMDILVPVIKVKFFNNE